MQCEQLTTHLAAAGGGDIESEAARRHVDSCLHCQAEVAQYRKLLKALQHLRQDLLTPAPGLVTDILVSIEQAGERHAVRSALRGRRAAYLGGIAVASAAAAAGAAALVLTRRRLRLRLAG